MPKSKEMKKPNYCSFCGTRDISITYIEDSRPSNCPEGNLFPTIFRGFDVNCAKCGPYRVEEIDLLQPKIRDAKKPLKTKN